MLAKVLTGWEKELKVPEETGMAGWAPGTLANVLAGRELVAGAVVEPGRKVWRR